MTDHPFRCTLQDENVHRIKLSQLAEDYKISQFNISESFEIYIDYKKGLYSFKFFANDKFKLCFTVITLVFLKILNNTFITCQTYYCLEFEQVAHQNFVYTVTLHGMVSPNVLKNSNEKQRQHQPSLFRIQYEATEK